MPLDMLLYKPKNAAQDTGMKVKKNKKKGKPPKSPDSYGNRRAH
jgi:hypothetical protein